MKYTHSCVVLCCIVFISSGLSRFIWLILPYFSRLHKISQCWRTTKGKLSAQFWRCKYKIAIMTSSNGNILNIQSWGQCFEMPSLIKTSPYAIATLLLSVYIQSGHASQLTKIKACCIFITKSFPNQTGNIILKATINNIKCEFYKD